MKKQFKIIVAHPDDELIFFSSILKSKSRKVICFTVSEDKNVNKGREVIQTKAPFKNWLFLNQRELSTYSYINSSSYIKSYQKLKSSLSKIIEVGDTIYTHNPWGEYGHEDHIQVFKAVKDLKKKFRLKIFMNGYVSNKSYNLMQKKQHLISNKIQYKIINKNFTNKLKKIYISNNCWTFDDNYIWPKIEVFFQISNINNKFSLNKKNTSSPPLNFMNDNYKVNVFKKILEKLISYKLKKKIKNFIHKY